MNNLKNELTSIFEDAKKFNKETGFTGKNVYELSNGYLLVVSKVDYSQSKPKEFLLINIFESKEKRANGYVSAQIHWDLYDTVRLIAERANNFFVYNV